METFTPFARLQILKRREPLLALAVLVKTEVLFAGVQVSDEDTSGLDIEWGYVISAL